MSLWLAKDYIKKALNRWDLDGKYWVKEALKEIEGVEAEVEQLEDDCKRMTSEKIHLRIENRRLRKLLKEIKEEPLAVMKIRQALKDPPSREEREKARGLKEAASLARDIQSRVDEAYEAELEKP